jgi:hypothetical protein
MKTQAISHARVLQAILGALPDHLYLLDEQLEIEWSNKKARNSSLQSGFSKRKKSCYSNILGSARPCSSCPTRKALQSGQTESAEVAIETGGESRYYRIISVPIRNRALILRNALPRRTDTR